MTEPGTVTVEFLGLPRRRAGRAELVVAAATVGQILAAVERACPGLAGLVQPDGKLSPHYLVSLDGQRFIQELDQPVHANNRVIVLSADAGG